MPLYDRRSEARNTLSRCRVPLDVDFHALDSAALERLEYEADMAKYRAPRNANGSRLRYFHAMLRRRATAKIA